MAAQSTGSSSGVRFCYLFSAPLVKGAQSGSSKFVAIDRPLNLARELKSLQSTLEHTHRQVEWKQAVASPSTFSKVLADSPDILHFSGHGEKGYLCMEDDSGVLCPVRSSVIDTYLHWHGGAPPVVFVAACHSESVAHAFVNAGCPHVICINQQDEVNDVRAPPSRSITPHNHAAPAPHGDPPPSQEAALKFAREFYSMLIVRPPDWPPRTASLHPPPSPAIVQGSGRDVGSAFFLAKNTVSVEMGARSPAEVNKFLLLPEPPLGPGQTKDDPAWRDALRGMHRLELTKICTPGKFVQATGARSSTLPDMPPTLYGRDLRLQELYRSLTRSGEPLNLVTLHGPPSVGKSALATALAVYTAQRLDLQQRFSNVCLVDAAAVELDLYTDRQAAGQPRVWGAILSRMGLPPSLAVEQPQTIVHELASKLPRALFVLTRLDVEGRREVSQAVVEATLAFASRVLQPLVGHHSCAAVLTSRRELEHGWRVSNTQSKKLEPLQSFYAGQMLCTKFAVQNAPQSTWAGLVPRSALSTASRRPRRDIYFEEVGKHPLLRICGGLPGVIEAFVQASGNKSLHETLDESKVLAGMCMLKTGQPIPPGTMRAELEAEAKARVDSERSTAAAAAAGGAPSTHPGPGLSHLPSNPPHMSGAAMSGFPGMSAFSVGSSLSRVPSIPPQSFHLTQSKSDGELPKNQVEQDVPELWAALTTALGSSPQAQSVCLPPASDAGVLWSLVHAYATARLPHCLGVRALTEHDVRVMTLWIYQCASQRDRAGRVLLSQRDLRAAVESRLMVWVWMMKIKVRHHWTRTVHGTQTPYLHGFLDKNEAWTLLQQAGSQDGTFLLRFSASDPKSITMTVATEHGQQAWNCRLSLTVNTDRTSAHRCYWEYTWRGAHGKLHVNTLDEFVERHRDQLREQLHFSRSTYADDALPAHLASGGMPASHHSRFPSHGPHLASSTSMPMVPGMHGGVPPGALATPTLAHSGSAMAGFPGGAFQPPAMERFPSGDSRASSHAEAGPRHGGTAPPNF